MYFKKVFFQCGVKFLHIRLARLPPFKLLPRRKQIF